MSNTNTNRDILMTVDVKTSKVSNGGFSFYITDKNTSNFFIRLVMSMSTNALISNYVTLEKASNYRLELFIIKPDNRLLQIDAELMDEQNALFQFNLTEDCKDMLGKYTCEFWVHSTVNDEDEVITTDSFTYTVKPSIANNLDDVIEKDTDYPLVTELANQLEELIDDTQDLQTATSILNEDVRKIKQEYENLIDRGLTDDVRNFVLRCVEEAVAEEISEVVEEIDDIQQKNYEQDMNIKCLFSHTSYSVDAEIVGNDAKLINSKAGTGYINRIEGDTKVNVCNQKDPIPLTELAIKLAYIKPSTEYIIQFEADNDGIISDIWLGGDFKHNIAVTKGINKIQGTTAASVDDYLNIKGMGANISNIVVTEKLDYDFDYFEGLSSAFESEYDEELGKYKVEYKVYKASFGIQDFEFGKGGRLQ